MSARQLFVLMCKVLNIEERIYIGKPKLERNQLAAINAMLVDNLFQCFFYFNNEKDNIDRTRGTKIAKLS